MYLKSIEVQGFKSFANKILFEFHNGITGIVGPNGSGKSNVADAVRWVLGEQSAKSLRGGSMQDVIFAGTETRRPLSFAYVAITLDNSDHKLDIDYEEVTVARRLYRSGESEYLMNGTPCRMRDIRELFYDTGIGKEGYSIIGQGQIDRILSTRPEETRELFDEATGIVKFKRRKNETLKKLEEERQDIVRINDIISELEHQLGPLERQSAKAREYLKKKEELKSYDINLFLLESERLDGELEAVSAKADTVSEELKETESSCEDLKRRYEEADAKLVELDAAIDEAKDELAKSALRRQEAESRIELLREQINSAQSGAGQIGERLVSIKADIGEKEASRLKFSDEKKSLDEELGQASALTKEADLRLQKLKEETDALSREATDVQTQLINLINAKASSRGKLQRLDATREQLELRKGELKEKLSESKEAERVSLEAYEAERSKFEKICSDILELTREKKAEEEAYDGYRLTLGRQNEEIEKRQAAYHREASRLESMRNMAERYEGYGAAVRKIMELKADNPGIHGTVADLFRVEKKYETAVETALGGNIRNIITEDEASAKELIGFLKKNRYGRATFLPLDSIGPRESSVKKEILSEKEVIGTASRLVDVDERYRKVADYLLGRIVVCRTLDGAAALARRYNHSLHIVTLEGDYLRPGGSMTGGAYRNSDNLLGRRREIEELSLNVEKLKAELEEARAKMEQVKEERRLCRSRAAAFDEELQQCFLKQNTAKLGADQAEKELLETRAGYAGIEESIADFENQLSDIEENRASVESELGSFEGGENEKKEHAGEIQGRLSMLKADEDALSKEVEGLRLKEAGLAQKADFLAENLERVEGELESLRAEKEELEKRSLESGTDIKAKESEIEALRCGIRLLGGSDEELKAGEAKLRAAREELSASRRRCIEEHEEALKAKALLDKELFRLNSQKEKLEEGAAAQADYMWQEYELTYNLALPYKNAEMSDRNRLKKQSALIKDEIKKLGDVNVNAIEDYKNISGRYGFLKTQRDDLVQAEEALTRIAAELDDGMRRQFETEFSKIKTEFDKAFKELFGGGKGTLEIDTDSDILEAGVRVIAQPPGKKLQNMLQLSGGEKALTAIALLFAIQNMKPSPFCLLDEIEAALDDSNVGRFSRYLRKLTKNTQFIIITHRKGTMEAADRLYGITMQEKGVSTLVSVNLIEEELDA